MTKALNLKPFLEHFEFTRIWTPQLLQDIFVFLTNLTEIKIAAVYSACL